MAKHQPRRTCVGCREVHTKRSLIRIVRTPEGVRIDPTSKLPGRGAYVHDRRECWERALAGSLTKALRTEIAPAEHDELVRYMKELPGNGDG